MVAKDGLAGAIVVRFHGLLFALDRSLVLVGRFHGKRDLLKFGLERALLLVTSQVTT